LGNKSFVKSWWAVPIALLFICVGLMLFSIVFKVVLSLFLLMRWSEHALRGLLFVLDSIIRDISCLSA
jgi:hypothetical protein